MQTEFNQKLSKFCLTQDVVVGANAGIFWADEHGVLWGGIAAIQQIPRYVWVGLKRIDKIQLGSGPIHIPPDGFHKVWLPGLGFNDFNDFKPIEGISEWSIRTNTIQNVVNNLLAIPSVDEFFQLDGMPLEVSILTDIRSGSGCNFSGAFSVALFTAIRLLAEKCGTVADSIFQDHYISEDALGVTRLTWGGDYMEQLKNPHSHLHKLNRTAMLLETYFHDGAASGYGSILPLIPTKWPMLYFRETPSAKRIDRKIEITDWENLTEDNRNLLTEKLLDPQKGLQYRLIPLEKTPAWPNKPPTRYPFSFGLLYSGMPKNTAETIAKVRKTALDIYNSFSERLSFLKKKETYGWPDDIEIPMGLKALEDLTHSEDSIHEGFYSVLMPGTLAVIDSLLSCLDLHDAPSEDQDNALKYFTDSIWGLQGGLAQLQLVDNHARWIIGRFVEYMKDRKGSYALKYTGGSFGGYLLTVAHIETDFQSFNSFLNPDKKSFLQGKNKFTLPRVDYFSTNEEPDGKGIMTSSNLISGKPRQWRMVCFKPTSDGWEEDSSQTQDHMYEWDWAEHVQKNASRQDYCMIDIDFDQHKNAEGQILMKGQSLKEYRDDEKTQGEASLAHALYMMLSKGGSCSGNDLKSHFSAIGKGEKYFTVEGVAHKSFLRKIQYLPIWQEFFQTIEFNYASETGDLIKMSILSKSVVNRVFMYLHHR